MIESAKIILDKTMDPNEHLLNKLNHLIKNV